MGGPGSGGKSFNYVRVGGVVMTMCEACRALGVSYDSVRNRHRRKGETMEQSLEFYCLRDNKTPPDSTKRGGLTSEKRVIIRDKLEDAMDLIQNYSECIDETTYTNFINLIYDVQEMIEE